jgi:hypothetical protein
MIVEMKNDDLRDTSTNDRAPAAFTETFERRDRRRLVSMPAADRSEFVEQLRAWARVGASQPIFSVSEVIGVAGDRLVLLRFSVEFGPEQTSEQLQVVLFDSEVDRLELMVSFDWDDVAAAGVELRSLADDVERGLV